MYMWVMFKFTQIYPYRYNKCHKCYSHLQSVREALSSKTNISGKMGSLFREMSLAFSSLD